MHITAQLTDFLCDASGTREREARDDCRYWRADRVAVRANRAAHRHRHRNFRRIVVDARSSCESVVSSRRARHRAAHRLSAHARERAKGKARGTHVLQTSGSSTARASRSAPRHRPVQPLGGLLTFAFSRAGAVVLLSSSGRAACSSRMVVSAKAPCMNETVKWSRTASTMRPCLSLP